MNVHASASFETFADEIVESGATRVFARSALEYGHDPELPAVLVAGLAVIVLHAGPAATTVVLPHAAISALHAAT